jgi:hypothetical protein
MSPYVSRVEVLPDYRMKLWFENSEMRVFDMRPYLERGVFKQLKAWPAFSQARVEAGSVEWPCGVDLSYDTLYLESVPEGAATDLSGSE